MTKLSMSEEEMLKRKYTRLYEERIAELEKENAQLKEAKELLKKVLDLKKVVTKAEEYLLLEEAEQFLKDNA